MQPSFKKENKHEVLVIRARSKKNKDLKKTQGSFWSLREDFLA